MEYLIQIYSDNFLRYFFSVDSTVETRNRCYTYPRHSIRRTLALLSRDYVK